MDYTQLQAVLAANIQAQKIAERDYQKAQAEADEWKEIYRLALKEGREDLVREAEFRKNIYAKKACNLKALLDEQTERVANFRRDLAVQSKTLPNSFTTSSILNSLEEKPQQIETRSQTTAKLPVNDLKTRLCKVESELEAMNTQLKSQQISISKLLKQNSAILEDVRNLLSEASFSTISQNHNSQAAIKTVQVVDAELEELRKQLDWL